MKCNALKADLFRGSHRMPDNVCDDPLHVISSEQKKKKRSGEETSYCNCP